MNLRSGSLCRHVDKHVIARLLGLILVKENELLHLFQVNLVVEVNDVSCFA